MDDLLTEIEAFCAKHQMSVWDFGAVVLNDRPFVGQLRDGRDVRASTVRKCREWMAAYSPARDAA